MANLTRRHILAALAAISATPTFAANALTVVATTGMIADAARAIGGDKVQVRALMGPGVDPHAFRQTRSDIVAMTGADLVLYHGLNLEAQMIDFFGDLEGRTTVAAVAEDLSADRLLADDDYAGQSDPHIWMDPDLWQGVVERVTEALMTVAPEDAETFRANAAAYSADIGALSKYAIDGLASVPAESRVLVTAHDAFNYFGNAYGFEVEGIQGISTESEAGLNRIAELVEMLVTRDIGAVFVESSVSDRNIRALIEGAAARGHDVRIGGELYSDAMGEQGTYEGTYLGMIDHNVTTIAAALGGTVPARGRLGKLGASS
ncbi:metal ABC transporter solute-binding protein, Zn/Mn family [Actibacterium sp. 188UL27-1]|uniref:metal ABC transporter solute-binding protein, Zn/Mn family n=1 Tax=Actibacterium sp. 188UL27-1 TaxID=2786961 RepID=UPI001959877A|nr:zinc ABC transporter substrate-binding protein [Actibacterium sp. 188UL27-1]MBM7068289.1 zinc ABC transporter substrate-binding protein [Actibacterium sp. 188UL27-1]